MRRAPREDSASSLSSIHQAAECAIANDPDALRASNASWFRRSRINSMKASISFIASVTMRSCTQSGGVARNAAIRFLPLANSATSSSEVASGRNGGASLIKRRIADACAPSISVWQHKPSNASVAFSAHGLGRVCMAHSKDSKQLAQPRETSGIRRPRLKQLQQSLSARK
jgi:hypothetical protein